MRKLFTAFAATGLLAAGMTATLSVSNAEAQMRELRFAEFGPNRGTRAAGLKWLDEQLRERSGGKLGLNISWGGALLGAKTAAQGLSDGVADMASIVPVYAPGKLVAYEVVDTLQFADEWVGMMATYDFMTKNPEAIKEQRKANLRYFGNYTTGPTQLLTKDKPVTNGEDLKGLTIRATGAFVPAMKSQGAATVSMSQPKVYEALSNGSADGSTTYYYVAKAYKHYEVANYITELNMGQVLAFGIALNETTFQSLSADHQKLITDLGREFTVYMAEKMNDSRTSVKKELQDGIGGHKVTIVEPSPDLRKAMVDVAEADIQKWIEKAEKKKMPAQEILSAYKELVAQYEKERDEKGYPWKR